MWIPPHPLPRLPPKRCFESGVLHPFGIGPETEYFELCGHTASWEPPNSAGAARQWPQTQGPSGGLCADRVIRRHWRLSSSASSLQRCPPTQPLRNVKAIPGCRRAGVGGWNPGHLADPPLAGRPPAPRPRHCLPHCAAHASHEPGEPLLPLISSGLRTPGSGQRFEKRAPGELTGFRHQDRERPGESAAFLQPQAPGLPAAQGGHGHCPSQNRAFT